MIKSTLALLSSLLAAAAMAQTAAPAQAPVAPAVAASPAAAPAPADRNQCRGVQAAACAARAVGDGGWAGELRLAAFSAAELFVLPSHSENFGIALLEAIVEGC